MVTTPRRAVDPSSGPYTCTEIVSASPQIGATTCFARCCPCEQNPLVTPTKRGLPVPFESALLATAPAAIRYDDTAAWLPGDEQTRQQQGMETSTALSIIDTIAAMRDDSIAVSSTVDSSHQASQTHETSNKHGGAHRKQSVYPTSPILLQHQHSPRPHIVPYYSLKDKSPSQHSSDRLRLATSSNTSKLCGDKPHASTINRISHEQCQAEIAQLSAQNAELQSQLQSCTEQITVMHGRVEKADTERDEYANQVTQLREWLDDVRTDRNKVEARMMAGSGTAAQDTRADLEDSIIRLGREKNSLQAAVSALEIQQRQSHEYLGSQTALEGKVMALQSRLGRQKASRHQLEAHMKDLYADYTNLQQLHGALEQTCSAVEGERDKLEAALKERDERCAALKERARSKTSVLEQLRNAAQALVQDKERVATQLAEAVMHQSKLASDNARMNEDLERLQGGFEEVALAMDVLSLKTGSAQDGQAAQATGKPHAAPQNGNCHAQLAKDESTRAGVGKEHTTVRQIIQWLEDVKADKDTLQKLLDQAQKERQLLQDKVNSVEEARLSAQQELIELHKQAADEKRAAHADAEVLRQAAEERENRLQELERDLTDAASEVEGLLRDKDDLSLAVDALQTDLASERRLNEEMQSILDSFRNQDM